MHLFEGEASPARSTILVFDEMFCDSCDVQWHPSPAYEDEYGKGCFECGGPGQQRWAGERKPRPWVDVERSTAYSPANEPNSIGRARREPESPVPTQTCSGDGALVLSE